MKVIFRCLSLIFLFLHFFSARGLCAASTARILTSNASEIVLELRFPATSLQLNPACGAYEIGTEGSSVLLIKGAPALPFFSFPIELDDSGQWQAEILDSVFHDRQNVLIAPSRGNLKRNQDLRTVPYSFGPVYSQSSFFPSSVISLSDPYIIRNSRGTALRVMAARYLGSAKLLRTYDGFTIRLRRLSSSGINPLPAYSSNIKNSLEWKQILQRHFLPTSSQLKYNPTPEDGSMLIICHNDTSFLHAMQAFVRWKSERGMKVQMITYAQAGGSAASMKAYIQNTFAANSWSYILIVGDAPQIPPAYITAGPSDQWFGDVVGNDHYTDILVGRFSANNLTELQTQVRRSIWYEKEITGAANYLSNAIGIGSDEGPGDDAQMDWEHQRGILSQLSAFTYQNGFELYDGSHGGNDAAGNPSASDLAALVNDGAGIINYTGHGGSTSFVTTGFSNTEVNALSNNGKLPFIYAVACVNGEFQSGTCFAEAWLRAEHNGSPAGAAAAMMSTINQSWNPPMEGQDEMNAILTESITGNIKRTYAGIGVNGCLKMNDSYGSAGTEMTDTWTIFGDPSLLVRTDTPTDMIVSHPATVTVGTTQLTVNVNTDSAMVALSSNGVLLSSSLVSSGIAALSFSPLSNLDSLLVTVTGFNKITYQGPVAVLPANSPYVVLSGHVLQDPLGNQNQLADYDENVEMFLNLSNLGMLDAINLSVQVQTADTFIQNVQPSALSLSQLNAGAQISLGPVQFQTKPFVPDGHVVVFDVQITSGTQNLSQSIPVLLHAPVLLTSGFVIDDQLNGNGNGRLEAGETASVTIQVVNSGTSVSPSGSVELISLNNAVSVAGQVQFTGPLAPGSSQLTYQIEVSASDTSVYRADFEVQLLAGPYQHQSPRNTMVNQIIEDFESNDLLSWAWSSQGNTAWFTTTEQPYEGTYCSESGNIDDSQSSSLLITLDVASNDSISFMRRVSSEQDWDYLQFYIDNNLVGEWSGSLAWQRFVSPVTAGQHVFRWTYQKDSYYSDGSDCAWIDRVVWPPVQQVLDTNSVGFGFNEELTSGFSLFPNPSEGFSQACFVLPVSGKVSAFLYNAIGQKVRTILPEVFLPMGRQTIQIPIFDLPSGSYFLQLNYPGATLSKAVLVKK